MNIMRVMDLPIGSIVVNRKGKEYKMWGHLFDMAQTMDLSGVNFIKNKETGSGVYWEPF